MLKSVYKLLSNLLLPKRIHIIRGLVFLDKPSAIKLNRLDYVRIACLDLIAKEITEKGVAGSVAELGVYKGDFAGLLNEVFSDRTLYLFDTFEGFDPRDIAAEKAMKLDYNHVEFSDTSAEAVLSKMPHPGKCKIRKGYFPESALGLENEVFCFVSLDADLYEPTLRGLEFFYKRLSPGGYIMVHDYNNSGFMGCKKAVNEFCKRERLSYTPIPDIGGTAILSKGWQIHE